MADHLGEVYEGVISGVTEWGLYVELDANKCEGLVPVRDLPGDYYDFDEKNYSLVGRRTGVRYRLGDKVKVQVARCDIAKKMLDFALLDDEGQSLRRPSRPTPWRLRPQPRLEEEESERTYPLAPMITATDRDRMTITLDSLRFYAYHGVGAQEACGGQRIW